MIKIHAFVYGRVQGVFYRHHLAKQAKKLGLSGWVRNRLDGRVEIIAVGPPQEINQIIKWLWQGPATAQVTKVEIVSQKTIDKDPFKNIFKTIETV